MEQAIDTRFSTAQIYCLREMSYQSLCVAHKNMISISVTELYRIVRFQASDILHLLLMILDVTLFNAFLYAS